VDTTGAGDATVAGFLAALLPDQMLEQAVTMACAVGACNADPFMLSSHQKAGS